MIFAILIQIGLAGAVSRIVYLCYFHPLARYPGPFWARFTNIWRFLNFLGGQHHLSEQRLHEKYGRVVRVAPNWLSFSQLEDFEAIYAGNKLIEKSDFYTFGRGNAGTRSIFSTKTDALHREKKRKVVGPAFTSVKVSRYDPIIEKHVDIFLSRLDILSSTSGKAPADNTKATLNIAPLVHQFTMDVMLETLFGPALPSHPFTDSSVAGGICSDIRNINKIAWSCSLWPLFGWIMNTRPADYFFRKPKYNGDGEMVSLSAVLNAGHIAVTRYPEKFIQSAQPGIVKSWLEVPVDGMSCMTPAELVAEASNLVFAGPGSTAAVLTALLFQLGTEEGQKWQKILQKEASAAKGSSLFASFPSELQAVIKETLRYSAAFPTAFPRVIMPGAETALPSLRDPLPVGTTVSANTYVLGRSREIWGEDANQWLPQRWLGDEQHRRMMDIKLVAFSKGPRVCVGRDLVLLVIARVVLAVVTRWNLRSVGVPFGKSYLEMQYESCCIEYTPLSSSG